MYKSMLEVMVAWVRQQGVAGSAAPALRKARPREVGESSVGVPDGAPRPLADRLDPARSTKLMK